MASRSQGVGNHAQRIGQDAHVGDGAAEPLREAGDDVAVGIVDAALAERRARLIDLVACGEYRHPQPTEDREPGASDGSSDADVLGPESPAGGQDGRAGRDILSGIPPVGAALDPGRYNDGIAVCPAVLLHQHGVGAGGHRRAGEDANRLAAHGRAPERVPGGSPPGAGQPRVPAASRSSKKTA